MRVKDRVVELFDLVGEGLHHGQTRVPLKLVIVILLVQVELEDSKADLSQCEANVVLDIVVGVSAKSCNLIADSL